MDTLLDTLLTDNQRREITRNMGRGNAEVALCRAQEIQTKQMLADVIKQEATDWGTALFNARSGMSKSDLAKMDAVREILEQLYITITRGLKYDND